MAALVLQRTLTHKRGECKPFGAELIFWPMIIMLTNFQSARQLKVLADLGSISEKNSRFRFQVRTSRSSLSSPKRGREKNPSRRYIIFSCTACDLSHGSFLNKIAALNSNTLPWWTGLCALIVKFFFPLKGTFEDAKFILTRVSSRHKQVRFFFSSDLTLTYMCRYRCWFRYTYVLLPIVVLYITQSCSKPSKAFLII